jgi:catechol 2,3-dioxygenase-like lactoylglutathione lyase family enzyme
MITPTGISHIAMVTADLDRFRAFYEGTVGVDTALVLGPGEEHGRHAIVFVGDVVLHVFEVDGYDPADQGFGHAMFERGRLDHLGFGVADEVALGELRDRLVAAGASRGEIRSSGPILSVGFVDPDGLEGEITCLDPRFDPAVLGAPAEIVDPGWYERARRAFGAVAPAAAVAR